MLENTDKATAQVHPARLRGSAHKESFRHQYEWCVPRINVAIIVTAVIFEIPTIFPKPYAYY